MPDGDDRDLHREPIIEPNGSEYLVTVNGSVFLALTLVAAERMARRMAGRRREAALAAGWPADAYRTMRR